MFTNEQRRTWPSAFVFMVLFPFLLFTFFSSGFAKPSKVGISPHIIRPNRQVQTFDFTFPLDGGYQNSFEILCPSSCEKLILVGLTLDKEHFWLKRSEKRPQEKGYATWSYNPHKGLLTVRIAPGKLSSQGEAKLSFSAQGLSGQGPFKFTLKAYEGGRKRSSIEFTDEVFRGASD